MLLSFCSNARSLTPMIVYNKTAPATGSLNFPLNYALEPFSCHFELSRQPAVGLGPPFALSGNFNVAIESNARPVIWSQNTGNNPSAASTGANLSPTPQSTVSSEPSEPTVGTQASGSSGLSQGAKIGLGVGVALGVLALIVAAAGFFWFRRRRRNTRQAGNRNPHLDPQSFATPHPNATRYATGKPTWLEMPAEAKVHEKDSAPVASQTLGELEAPR